MALLTLLVVAPVVAHALQGSPAWVGLYVSVTCAGATVATLMGFATVACMGAIRVRQWGCVLWACSCALGYRRACGLNSAVIAKPAQASAGAF
jgi:hypothetical protein